MREPTGERSPTWSGRAIGCVPRRNWPGSWTAGPTRPPQQTYDLLGARNNTTLAEQRRGVAGARVARAAEAIAGIDAMARPLVKTVEVLRQTGLHAITV